MNINEAFISYNHTGAFSKMVTDYISGNDQLKPFYSHPVSMEGIKNAIESRKQSRTDRNLLVNELQKQYQSVGLSGKTKSNIELLANENTFTICTAHQPNIFTGHLYFIYKILHAIKLAAQLAREFPAYNFVPVFYMGSEDADLEELGHIWIDDEKYEWKTSQSGAVGRMKVDKALLQLLDSFSGRLLAYPFGEEIVSLMRDCYQDGVSIEQASFKLIHNLFAEYGLIVLLPANREFKKVFAPVVKQELEEQFSQKAIKETIAEMPGEYKVQAGGREVNLFYLKEDSRERIVMDEGKWSVGNSTIHFNTEGIVKELADYPERFSPNVILRPVFQEMILPNIVFIGGGGEIAYWLELKKVFEAVNVPFPVMVLRNSFLLLNKEQARLVKKLQFKSADLFKPESALMNEIVKRHSTVQLNLEKEKQQLIECYEKIRKLASKADPTLENHTDALKSQALKKITSLEKKMWRAERKKFEAQQRQLKTLKKQLFPDHSLQERIGNIMPFYAKWGKEIIKSFYNHSKGMEQEFCILIEQ